MLFWQIRTRYLLALAALFVGAAFLDLNQPGRGRFYNPVYGMRSWFNTHQPAAWQLVTRVQGNDGRLQACVAVAPDPVALDATKAELRKALVGESESVALEWLGQPACALGNGVYRWALDNGLALDVSVSEGEVTHSELNR
ncbi:hypothetical protein VB780_16585 [Leptolyngbya sp. CCNP1308]|uniref:hypothetical protein n=1 Tax=Leptolyngbya sp. CCNP1308 TaxID=3110255 RepID=UPI002B206563|nr:hypothetical protein [Leptolyngbya sp. CCNP1308]MEA5450199.1 hypothetical protein [Leptolyngbya sp. CCNP1308]